MKKATLFSTAAMMACGLAAAPAASANVLFETSFTTADGFVDGDVNFTGDNPDTIVGQGGYSIDADGAGFLIGPGGTGFQRVLLGRSFGANTAGGTVSDFTSQAAGDSYVVDFEGITLGGTGFGIINLGLANEAANILGGSSNTGNFLIGTASGSYVLNSTQAGQVSTGVAVGSTFDVSITYLANGDGTFDITANVDGVDITTNTAVTPTFSQGPTGLFSAYINEGGAAGTGFSLDAVRISSFEATVIPEPASLILLGLGGLAIVGRRRRA
ncbi:MAG: PEP-CTERM sorting domain-containing protein [Planctomycetota bacterium]